MAVEIVRFARTDRRRFTQFLKLPRALYRDDPHWVPELLLERRDFHNPRKNPIFAHLDVTYLLALRDGVPVGRITAHINSAHNAAHDEHAGFFGFFESPDDPEVANALFDAAAEILREKSCTVLRGPANYSSNEEWGALHDGFDDPPCILMLYNPEYHLGLYEQAGFAKAMDLYAWDLVAPDNMERYRRVSDKSLKRSGVRIREMRIGRAEWPAEIEVVRQIYNEAWERNWGFIPMSDDEFRHVANDMRTLMLPKWCLIAEDERTRKPVGFSLTLPDVHQLLRHTRGRLLPTLWHLFVRKSQFNSRIVKRVRVITLGVVPAYRRKGIEGAFYARNFDNSISTEMYHGEISWVLETNEEMNNGARRMGATRYKTYRIWERPL